MMRLKPAPKKKIPSMPTHTRRVKVVFDGNKDECIQPLYALYDGLNGTVELCHTPNTHGDLLPCYDGSFDESPQKFLSLAAGVKRSSKINQAHISLPTLRDKMRDF
eukprot:459939-Ditylum_brightwellii.AAC.1